MPAKPAGTRLDSAQIEAHRAYLLRYATLQLRDAGAAEDAVQDTLIAALEGLDRFSGNSSLKTWLTGILKHKIIDHHRRQAREQPLTEDDERSETDAVDALFKTDGLEHAARQLGRPRSSTGKQEISRSAGTVHAKPAGENRSRFHDARCDGDRNRGHL
jgi:RNA polymerase sigma-70 factor (ECF subfamily)